MQNVIARPNATHVKLTATCATTAVNSLGSRCVKCGEDYSIDKCTKDSSIPAKCALCSGAHTASYKGCTVYKKLTKSTNKPKKVKIQTQHVQTHRHASNSPSSSQSYASVTAAQPTSSTPDSTSKMWNEFKTLLNPLISLLTVILNKITTKFP